MTSPSLIDSHCHLDFFLPANELSPIIASSRDHGVSGWVVPGVAPEAWPAIQRLAGLIPAVHAAYGLHPLWAPQWSSALGDELCRLLAGAVAVGEIGLDYSVPGTDRQLQQQVFRVQLRIARDRHLPVLIHCRQAFADCLAIAKAEGIVQFGGVMHAYSGSLEVARECVKLGLFIGVAGPITYAGARRLPLVVKTLGLQHLVLETDSPDLAPEPYRGKNNAPENLPLIAKKTAQLCGATLAEVAAITSRNISKLLKLAE